MRAATNMNTLFIVFIAGDEGAHHPVPVHPVPVSNDGNDRICPHDGGHRSGKVAQTFTFIVEMSNLLSCKVT